MYANDGTLRRPPGISRTAGPLLIGLLMLTVSACQEALTDPDGLSSATAAADATTAVGDELNGRHDERFPHWLQTFNHGTEGWYGGDEAGMIGWCGDVSWHRRGTGPVSPSRSSGYATVAQGECNAFWGGAFPNLLGAPWAPGPEASNFSSFWPRSGFLMQLDIYLDPSWTNSSIPCEFPTEEPFFPPLQPCNYFAVHPNSVFTIAASLRETVRPPGLDDVFTYFAVPVMPGSGALSIFGHDITRPGWYTFKWSFRDDGGQVEVLFELSERRGGPIFTESIEQRLYGGTTSSLAPRNWGSGYLYFVRISPHLEIPIDHHHLRRGS